MPAALRRIVGGRKRWEQRGAAALVMALVTCFAVIPMGAMAIDLGMQRVARNDAQALADTAAMDAARGVTIASTNATVTADAQASVLRDAGAVGTGPAVSAVVGYIAPSATWQPTNALGCDGAYSNNYFKSATDMPSGATPNAVLVIVKNSVTFGLANSMGFSSGGVCRSSIAIATPLACTMIGSYLASLDSSNSGVLNSLFAGTGSLSLTVAGYQGLANSSVSLGDLANVSSLHVGSADELLSTDFTAAQLATAMATVLTSQGNTSAAADLTTLAAALATKTSASVPISDLIDVGAGTGGSAASLAVSPLDLLFGAVTTAAQLNLVNGTNLLATGITLGVTGLAGAKLYLKVIEAPKIGCYPNSATTGQIHLVATGTLLAGAVTLSVDLGLATAEGSVTSLTCSGGSPASMSVTMTDLEVLTESVTATVTLAGIALGASATSSPTATSSMPQTYPLSLSGSPDNYVGAAPSHVPVQANNTAGGLPTLHLSAFAPTDGSTLSGLVAGTVSTLLSPVVSALSIVLGTGTGSLNAVLSTTLGLLGINVAGADISAVRTPDCGVPSLR